MSIYGMETINPFVGCPSETGIGICIGLFVEKGEIEPRVDLRSPPVWLERPYELCHPFSCNNQPWFIRG